MGLRKLQHADGGYKTLGGRSRMQAGDRTTSGEDGTDPAGRCRKL